MLPNEVPRCDGLHEEKRVAEQGLQFSGIGFSRPNAWGGAPSHPSPWLWTPKASVENCPQKKEHDCHDGRTGKQGP